MDIFCTGVGASKNPEFVILHLESEINLSKEKGYKPSAQQIFAGFTEGKSSTYHHWPAVKKEMAIHWFPQLSEIINVPPTELVSVNPTALGLHNGLKWRMLVFETTNYAEIKAMHGKDYEPKPKQFKGKILRKNGEPIYMTTVMSLGENEETHVLVKHDN